MSFPKKTKSNSGHNLGVLRLQNEEGFTLLELMVVMIITSVLAAISLPAFYSQIGKAREAEVQMKLGAIARSQQAYHYSYGDFAPTLTLLQQDSGIVSSNYYTFPNPVADSTRVKHQAIAINPNQDQVRDYAIGVYFNNSAYNRATCQAPQIGAAVNVGDLASDNCTNGGSKVQ